MGVRTHTRGQKIGFVAFLSIVIATTAHASVLDWVTADQQPEQEHFEIIGSVVCTTCQADEIQAQHSDAAALYPVIHPQGQFIFRVDDVSGLSLRRTLTWPEQVDLRLADHLFHMLAAQENRFKKLRLDARLNSGNIVEILDVHFP